jgi:AraC-like DNA-binding protein
VSFSPRSVVILKGSPAGATTLPHPALAANVSSFWELHLAQGSHRVRSLPDGCVDLTFDLSPAGPAAYVTGPQLEPRTFDLSGRVALLGVRLAPGAAPPLLGRCVGSTDLWVPLSNWVGAAATTLVHAVAQAADTPARIQILEEWLTQRLLGGAEDARLGRSIELIFRSGGSARIAELAGAAGVSERALSRLFTGRVGLPPKRFSRVVRFQRVLRRVEGCPDWAQLAIELGYFDQAHMIREFRTLFGCTPGEAVALIESTH